MSYFKDFGEDSPNVDLTQQSFIPQCINPKFNTLVDVAKIWPKYFWSTHITGEYATGEVSAYLRSIGCDPIKIVEPAPFGVYPHTVSRPTSNGVLPTKALFTLSRDLLYDMDRLPIPENWAPLEWNNNLKLIKEAIDRKDEITLQNLAQSLQLVMNGYKHGLTVWLPAQFKSQAHLNAWLAHYLEWRYGWDSLGGKGLFLKCCYAPHPSADSNILQRSILSNMEGTGYGRTFIPENSVKKIWESSIKYWPRSSSTEVFPSFDFSPVNFVDQKTFFRLNLLDEELGSKLIILHTLLCCQMACYAKSRNIPDAFPGGKYIPCNIKEGNLGTTFIEFIGNVSSLASSFVLGAGGGGFKAIQGLVQTQVKNIIGSAISGSHSLANLPLPNIPQWAPVAVNTSNLTDPLACYEAGITTFKIVSISPTLIQKALSQKLSQPAVSQKLVQTAVSQKLAQTAASQKLVQTIQEQKKPFPYLLLGAAGLGAYLLLKDKKG